MTAVRTILAGFALLAVGGATLSAQEHPLNLPPRPGRYTPLDQNAVPGQAAHWALLAKPALHGYFQPVRIDLPSQGLVSFYDPSQPQPVLTQAPAQARMLIGPVYRCRVTGLPEYPGVELFPTIELLDRLHPPAGQEDEFPIPIEITAAEIEAVLQDRMVTKVVYLEAPQLASTHVEEQGLLTYDAPARSNLLDSAGQLGRPVAILRLGGRIPDPRNPNDEMFRQLAPIQVLSHVP
jgi:hypothetical protein